jgi:hypothetical protein
MKYKQTKLVWVAEHETKYGVDTFIFGDVEPTEEDVIAYLKSIDEWEGDPEREWLEIFTRPVLEAKCTRN